MTIYTDTDNQNNAHGLPNPSVSGENSSGDDTYIFNANNGQDTIKDSGGNDTLILNGGVIVKSGVWHSGRFLC